MSDQELQSCMEELYRKQQKFIKIQKIFIMLSIVLFYFAIIWLFAHIALLIIWGGYLSNKATSLARKKYPYVRLQRVGKGVSWDPAIITEATLFNDDLTVKIIKFNNLSMFYYGVAFFGNILMWVLAAFLGKYVFPL